MASSGWPAISPQKATGTPAARQCSTMFRKNPSTAGESTS
jgi:hypothetical protein